MEQINVSASATVEGALVIPLFVYAAVAIIFMLHVYLVRTQVNNALYNTIRKLNRYVYISQTVKEMSDEDKNDIIKSFKQKEDIYICKSVITNVELMSIFIKEIGSDYAGNNYITGGNAGWNFTKSEIIENGSIMSIKLSYTIYNPFNIWGKQGIYIEEHCITDAWLGDDKSVYVPSEYNGDDIYVYITENGTVFHTNINCTYLLHNISSASINEISQLRNQAGAKYYKCNICKGNSEVVYYTPYGRRYHTSSLCDVLVHNIKQIKREVAEKTMRCCIKCAGEEKD